SGSSGVVLLQAEHGRLRMLQIVDALNGRLKAGECRDARDPESDGRRPDVIAVFARSPARRRVHDEVDLAFGDEVSDVRAALADLRHGDHLDAVARKELGRARRRVDLEAEVDETAD